MSIQTCCGMGKGCNRPARARVEYLFLWQVSHSAMKVLISLLIPSQNKKLAIFCRS
ncbi:hypothetical protein Lalb_Chr01g0021811 [Lupinus albus]|uniref:Uncharacterized protein n=1 Tax=Lupinus albus TaxID=3870 RepID=A0A6A4R801_LUPAL|nr:hypothetical protein Lalb_Chr01g0021811 [Lupinus albus]